MITEIAILTVDPQRTADFEMAVAQAATHFRAAEGCRSMALERVVEEPGRYHLVVGWDSVEHHMKLFRESDGFRSWRSLAGPFFTAPPVVWHTQKAAGYF